MLRNTPEISVIIPCYNVEKYLDRTVRSVIAQTFENWELILVDDGSKDNTAAICDGWASVDSRIKAFHQENMGASEARNHGMKLAEGKFINFIDSDDWVDIRYLEDLINTQKESDADLTVSGMRFIHDDRECNVVCAEATFSRLSFNVPLSQRQYYDILRGPCCKLFKRNIIDKKDLKFYSEISNGEDTIFVLQYILECNLITFSKEAEYNYDRRILSSLTHSGEVIDIRINDLEISIFTELADKCISRFSIDKSNRELFDDRLRYYWNKRLRALNSRLPYKERLDALKTFNVGLYKKYALHTSRWVDIQLWLISHHFYYLLDTLIVVKLRMQKMFN